MKRLKLERYILKKYKAETKTESFTQFAADCGVSVNEVRKWIDGYRSPRDYRKHLIEQLSKGHITLYDW
jgi:DNA-binding transcriptional regulator YiaG